MKKVGLKLNIQKTKIMASSSITSWQIDDGETVETVADFIFGGSTITTDCDYSHEMQRHSLLGMPQPKTRPDSPVPSLQGPCDRSLKSEEP